MKKTVFVSTRALVIASLALSLGACSANESDVDNASSTSPSISVEEHNSGDAPEVQYFGTTLTPEQTQKASDTAYEAAEDLMGQSSPTGESLEDTSREMSDFAAAEEWLTPEAFKHFKVITEKAIAGDPDAQDRVQLLFPQTRFAIDEFPLEYSFEHDGDWRFPVKVDGTDYFFVQLDLIMTRDGGTAQLVEEIRVAFLMEPQQDGSWKIARVLNSAEGQKFTDEANS